ncbi:endogenous retrovirus group 3 member 1 Env polyprotein-like [Lissotriton helveticus]
MTLDWHHRGKLCLLRLKTDFNNYFIGSSEYDHILLITRGWGIRGGTDPVFPGISYVCGKNAYYRLPAHLYGCCYMGIVFPKIYLLDKNHRINEKKSDLTQNKRGISAADIVYDIFGVLILSVGVILNSHKIRKLSTVVDHLSTDTSGGVLMIDTEMVAIRSMVLQNRLALDVLLAEEGGVCSMLTIQQCCTSIPDKSKSLEGYIRNITHLWED